MLTDGLCRSSEAQEGHFSASLAGGSDTKELPCTRNDRFSASGQPQDEAAQYTYTANKSPRLLSQVTSSLMQLSSCHQHLVRERAIDAFAHCTTIDAATLTSLWERFLQDSPFLLSPGPKLLCEKRGAHTTCTTCFVQFS